MCIDEIVFSNQTLYFRLRPLRQVLGNGHDPKFSKRGGIDNSSTTVIYGGGKTTIAIAQRRRCVKRVQLLVSYNPIQPQVS